MTDHRAAYGLITEFDPFQRIESDTLALADTAEGRLTEPVPSCPGWSVADLVWHLSEVHAWWGELVAGLAQDPAEVPEPVRPADDAELVAGLRTGVGRLVATLRAAEPLAPVWTWAPRRDVAFVVRHQVQEAAVHRWDAGAAVGLDIALDAAAASDAVEEFLQMSTGYRPEGAEPVGGPLALVATDTGLRWAVEESDGTVRWSRQRGEPEGRGTVLRGSASDLLLYLFRRRPAAALEVAGEVGLAERFALRNSTE